MADLAQVIDGEKLKGGGLREELVEHVYDVDEQYFPEKRFTCHEHTADQAIDEVVGSVPRLFAVTLTGGPTPAGIGSNSATTDVDRSIVYLTVRIWYPNGEQWKLAASSDFWRIVRALINDRGSHPSGVCDRFVDVTEEPEPEPTEDGFFMSIPVRCIVEHTTD